MSKLEDFLKLNKVDDITGKFTLNVQGKDFNFVVKAMNQEKFSEYQQSARLKVSNKGDASFNISAMNASMVAGQIIEPNFADAEFLAKAGCATAREFIKTYFPVGTIAEIASHIQKISGFDTEVDLVEEAKN